ncbi:MAG: ribosome small subunit-dependent GTPase A [Hydrogenophilus sp.]|nr:ribosome small subunit-dependent GTPase A [Hydrogenophilus sp.]
MDSNNLPSSSSCPPSLTSGWIIAVHGQHQLAATDSGHLYRVLPRKKSHETLCGDRVYLRPLDAATAIIEQRQPRTALFLRSDRSRAQGIAANIDTLLILVAPDPPISPEWITRALVAAEHAGITPLIALNKSDLLPDPLAPHTLLRPFLAAGYSLCVLSARYHPAPLLPHLHGRRILLTGPSGAGKSTLINALIPDAAARTGEISRALNAGRHTTTFTRLYCYDDGWIIDSPGIQRIGLLHLDPADLPRYFPEFRPYLGRCRYRDCRHRPGSSGCALLAALSNSDLPLERYRHYLAILDELEALPPHERARFQQRAPSL